MVTDNELIGRYLFKNDNAALEELIGRHSNLVMGVCRGMLMQTQDAEDAFQATFLILSRKCKSLLNHGSVAGWLYQTAVRNCLQIRRRKSRNKETEMIDDPIKSDEPWQTISQAQERELVYQAINRLPSRYRDAIVLCHLQGHSRAQAAEMLDSTEASIKAALSRGRNLLRQRLIRSGLYTSAMLVTLNASTVSAKEHVSQSLVEATFQLSQGLSPTSSSGPLGTHGTSTQFVHTLANQGIMSMNATIILKSVSAAAAILLAVSVPVLVYAQQTKIKTGKNVILNLASQDSQQLAEGDEKRSASHSDSATTVKIEGDQGDAAPATLAKYEFSGDQDLAMSTLQTMLESRDGVRMQADEKTGAIIVYGNKDDHQIVRETLATISGKAQQIGSAQSEIDIEPASAGNSRGQLKLIGDQADVAAVQKMINEHWEEAAKRAEKEPVDDLARSPVRRPVPSAVKDLTPDLLPPFWPGQSPSRLNPLDQFSVQNSQQYWALMHKSYELKAAAKVTESDDNSKSKEIRVLAKAEAYELQAKAIEAQLNIDRIKFEKSSPRASNPATNGAFYSEFQRGAQNQTVPFNPKPDYPPTRWRAANDNQVRTVPMALRTPVTIETTESKAPQKNGLQLELAKAVELYNLNIQLEESKKQFGSRHPEIDRLEKAIDIREREVNKIIEMRLREEQTRHAAAAKASVPPASTDPVKPGETLTIESGYDPSLNRRVVVQADHTIALPNVGTIGVKGLATSGVKQALEEACNKFFGKVGDESLADRDYLIFVGRASATMPLEK